jgi:hypothetical protein
MIFIPDNIVIDITIKYLTIYENNLINKEIQEIRNKKTNKALFKITVIIIRYKYLLNNFYMNDLLNVNHFNKNHIKKFYPLCYRLGYMELGLTKIHSIHLPELTKIYENAIKTKKIVYNFSLYIDLLTEQECRYIGW